MQTATSHPGTTDHMTTEMHLAKGHATSDGSNPSPPRIPLRSVRPQCSNFQGALSLPSVLFGPEDPLPSQRLVILELPAYSLARDAMKRAGQGQTSKPICRSATASLESKEFQGSQCPTSCHKPFQNCNIPHKLFLSTFLRMPR